MVVNVPEIKFCSFYCWQVRRSAQEAVRLLLMKPPGNVKHHPACSSTVKYCVQQIEKHGGKALLFYKLNIAKVINLLSFIFLVILPG